MIGDIRDQIYSLISPVMGDAVLSNEGEQISRDVRTTYVRIKVFPQETSNIEGRNAIGVNRIKEEPGRVMIEVYAPVRSGVPFTEDLAWSIVQAIETTGYTTPSGKLVVWSVYPQQVIEESPFYRVVVYATYSLFH